MGKTVTIHVTSEHVLEARRLLDRGLRPPLFCPIALALNAAGYPAANVFADHWIEDMTAVRTGGGHLLPPGTHLLTRRAKAYVRWFDSWQALPDRRAMPEPATFRLTL